MQCEHSDFKLYYLFEIYTNPLTKQPQLLFWGVGNYCLKCNKLYKFNKDIWAYNKFGYMRLKTYSDYIEKYGKLPCILIDNKKEPIDISKTYSNESTIRKEFSIKVNEKYQGHSNIIPDIEANL